jgi:hypothetical protein
VEFAQMILRGAVHRMVVYILRDFGMAEIEYRTGKYVTRVSSFKILALVRRLLEVTQKK